MSTVQVAREDLAGAVAVLQAVASAFREYEAGPYAALRVVQALDAVAPWSTADLLPRWRDLPALAWLAAGRFRVPARVPVLSSVVRGVSWPTFLMVLAAARGGGRLVLLRRFATSCGSESFAGCGDG